MKHLQWVSQALFIGLLAAGCVSNPVRPTSYPVTGQTPYPITEAPLTITSATASPGITPTLTAAPSGAWISLSPDSGGPGTTVRIDGYLPGGLPEDELRNDNYLTHADLCWGGCQNGLMESGLEVTWSSQDPGHFHSQFVVPSIPWLAADGLHPLKPGDYPVDILYLDPNVTGCSQSVTSKEGCPVTPQVSATFHLTEGYRGPECQEASSCGYLKATPARGAPGDTIRVQGWAPLLQIIGQPFGYDLVLETQSGASPHNLTHLAVRQGEVVRQAMDGSLTASFRVPQYAYDGSALSPGSYTLALLARGLTSAKNASPILVAPTPFEISAAPAWTQQKRSAPLWIQPSDSLDSVLSLDALDPNRLAYCVENAIRLSQDGGQSWTSIPTAPVSGLALPGNLVLDSQQPTCRSVLLDSAHLDSFYAVFGAMNKQYGMPPVYFLPFYTADRGKTWQMVPIPAVQTTSSLIEGRFGGFWTDGEVVQALYDDEAGNFNQTPPVLVKQTTNGGKTWTPASLACSPNGPCLRWGPAPAQVSGMGSDLPQDLLVSFDQGRTWGSTGESVELRANGPHELVALSQDEALVISGSAHYPLRYTSDGGRTWQALALPFLPTANPVWPFGFSGLQMFPDGSLLASNPDTGAWWALPPNARDWCSLEVPSPGKFPVLLQPSGERVWWLSAIMGAPEGAPVSSFSCFTIPPASTLQPTAAEISLPTPRETPLLLSAGLTVEEYALKGPPDVKPLSFTPLQGSAASILAKHALERSTPANPFFNDGRLRMQVKLGPDTLIASENFNQAGSDSWVTVYRNGEEIYRIDTGPGGPINALRGFWIYDGHWVLETARVTQRQEGNAVYSDALGQISQDGKLLNESYGYQEMFGFQLMAGRPFYFFKQNGQIGFAYGGQVVQAGYDGFLHYACCSGAAANPVSATRMVAFFALRDQAYYYVEIGVYQ